MKIIIDFALFSLGQHAVTQGAAVHAERFPKIIELHASGDFGELSQDDVKANVDALENGDARIVSCYPIDPARSATGSNRLYVITEADRSATTILLPEEY